MNIEELKQYGEDFTKPLVTLYQNTGNCTVSGFLGEELQDVYFDGDGKLFFSTHKESDEISIDSHGVVLTDSVLIRQVQKGRYQSSYRLYSWDVDQDMYTFISFDNGMTLKRYYDTIQRFGTDLCGEDISSVFQEMGLTFDHVNQILLNQKVSPIEKMLREEEEEEHIPYTM